MPDGVVKEFAGWISWQGVIREHMDAKTAKRFRATLWDQSSSARAPIPLVADRRQIGSDGQPARGLPPRRSPFSTYVGRRRTHIP
jgi:hypothetical protein